jgi:hypothetical protein
MLLLASRRLFKCELMHVEYTNHWYTYYMRMVRAAHNVFAHTRPYEELFFNTCTACVDNVNKGWGKKIVCGQGS